MFDMSYTRNILGQLSFIVYSEKLLIKVSTNFFFQMKAFFSFLNKNTILWFNYKNLLLILLYINNSRIIICSEIKIIFIYHINKWRKDFKTREITLKYFLNLTWYVTRHIRFLHVMNSKIIIERFNIGFYLVKYTDISVNFLI